MPLQLLRYMLKFLILFYYTLLFYSGSIRCSVVVWCGQTVLYTRTVIYLLKLTKTRKKVESVKLFINYFYIEGKKSLKYSETFLVKNYFVLRNYFHVKIKYLSSL